MNSLVIVGEELSNKPDFFEAAMQYVHDAAVTTELLHLTPKLLHPLLGFVSMHWSGALKRLDRDIATLVHHRLRGCSSEDQLPLDCVQWLVDAFSKQSQQPVKNIVQRVLGFFFASAHQVPMLVTFALYNLCTHPEYIRPLRDEIASQAEDGWSESKNEDLPLLDSLLRETARLYPLATTVTNRKVISPFTFSDGTHVAPGNWICVPQQAVMQDPANYPDPQTFNPFRFVADKDDSPRSEARFSHPSRSFPFWGAVGRACPARFYVSMMVKMIMIHLLVHYDFKLADGNVPPTFSWGSIILPHPRMALLIRKRVPDGE